MTDYHYWKWTTREPMNKSKRKTPQQTSLRTSVPIQSKKQTQESTLPQFITQQHTISGIKSLSIIPNDKKKLCNERISDRCMIIQTQINPYITKNNYVNDLEIQDKMLRPKNSNIGEN